MSKFTSKEIIIIIIFMSSCLLIAINLKGGEEFSDKNCADFQTQTEAQKVFEQNSEDIYGLDRNGDGVACNNLPTK